MNPSSDEPVTVARGARNRLRFEFIFASVWLGFGLFVLPAVIYTVGVASLGPYGQSKGMGAFYADFFRDLAEPSGRGWTIALGPLVIISLLRLVFLGVRTPRPTVDAAPHKPGPRFPAEQSRVEPRVGPD